MNKPIDQSMHPWSPTNKTVNHPINQVTAYPSTIIVNKPINQPIWRHAPVCVTVPFAQFLSVSAGDGGAPVYVQLSRYRMVSAKLLLPLRKRGGDIGTGRESHAGQPRVVLYLVLDIETINAFDSIAEGNAVACSHVIRHGSRKTQKSARSSRTNFEFCS